MSVATLDTPLSRLLGRGAAKLARELNLHTARDLLFYLPRRYEERGKLSSIGELELDQQVTLQARIVRVSSRPMRHRPGFVTQVVISDETGDELTLVFFDRDRRTQAWREKQLRPGRWGLFAGTVSEFRSGRGGVRQLAHPDVELLDDPDEEAAEDFASELIPIYPATKQMKIREITRAVRAVLEAVEITDPLPSDRKSTRLNSSH